VVGSCEYGKESLGSIKGGYLLDYLGGWHFLKDCIMKLSSVILMLFVRFVIVPILFISIVSCRLTSAMRDSELQSTLYTGGCLSALVDIKIDRVCQLLISSILLKGQNNFTRTCYKLLFLVCLLLYSTYIL
jgi:hypothetical protein